jgi:hypothetical protein
LRGDRAVRGHFLSAYCTVEDDWGLEYPETPTVWDDDPNPVIGEILDHRGEVLVLVRMEPDRRMGY